MTESSKAAAEKARDTYRKAAAQFEDLAGDAQVPEAMRALAEKNIAQTREIYERSKDALDTVLESWERSFDAVGQGAVALNRKVIDIAQRNINSSFDLAKRLAAAKNIAEAMELHGVLLAQPDQCPAIASRRDAHAVDQGNRRRGRTDQGTDDARPGLRKAAS